MAEITNKVITVPLLQHYKEKEDTANAGKYVGQEPGKQLIETEKVNKLDGLENIKEVQVNGQKLIVGEDGIVNIDIQGVIDGDGLATDAEVDQKLEKYTTTDKLADDPGIAGKYLDKDTAQSTYAKRDDIPKVQIPTCTQEELEEKKATAVDGDRVVVTDEEYHIYIYIGETGTGEWKDTGTHVVLTEYQKTADADNKYVAKDGDKVLVAPSDVTQITTNKNSIDSINEKLSGLQEAEEADIDALFAD